MSRTILHIDADAFFASVEQAIIPNIREKPVIVGGTAEQRGVVHTASYEARRLGVYTGMPLGHAKRQVPNAIFLKGSFERYKAVSEIFSEIYHRYTPVVEFTSLDDAYLDLTGTLNVHKHSPEEIAHAIQTDIAREANVTVSCGIGSAKFIARIASGRGKPGGLTYVLPGKELAFLHPLPVEELPGIGRVAREALHQLGVTTVGQLAELPKALLLQQFGINGQRFWEFANGIDSTIIVQKVVPKQLSRETGFEEDTSDMDIVLEVLRYLTERIGSKLREQGWEGQTVSIKVDYSDSKRYRKARSLPMMNSSTDSIFQMAKQLLAEAPFRRIRVHRVGLAVSKIQCQNLQGELFSETTRQDKLQATIDQIRRRFGFMSVMTADLINLQNQYRMEKSGYILHAPALTQ